MNIQLIRYSMTSDSTLGMLIIDDKFACYTLEDAHRSTKVVGNTCIPSGYYRINLRTEGEQNLLYNRKFPQMHKGMLHLEEVPGFQYIHIHIGNSIKDTEGCILVGDGANNNLADSAMISSSTNAYKRIYAMILKAMKEGEEVWIKVLDGLPENGLHSETTEAHVIANRLNLRKEPNSEIEGILVKGTETTVLKSQDGWSKIQVEGWVAQKYLAEE